MLFKITIPMIGCLLSLNATAGTMGNSQIKNYPWSVVGSLGYTWYDHAYRGGPRADPSAQKAIGDGQTALGRFAIAKELVIYSRFHFGAEVGVQSGNEFRLSIDQSVMDPLGGILPTATIKPMLDLLATVSYQPNHSLVFGLAKLGVAYRRMQINDRVTFNDLSQAALEIQAGVGVKVSDKANLSLNYQGVFNGNTVYTVNSTQCTGNISNILNQNGLLLTLAYHV